MRTGASCQVMRTPSRSIAAGDLFGRLRVWHSGAMSSIQNELFQLHASVCKGLADPKRLLILNALRDGERSVGDLCEELALPQANVSQHLAVLRDRGLVLARKDAQFVYYSVSSSKIIAAIDLLREVMSELLLSPSR